MTDEGGGSGGFLLSFEIAERRVVSAGKNFYCSLNAVVVFAELDVHNTLELEVLAATHPESTMVQAKRFPGLLRIDRLRAVVIP